MNPFEFVRAADIQQAIWWLGRADVKVLAGGTTLVDLMKLGVEAPSTVLDIGQLPLADIVLGEDRLLIGALVTNSQAAADVHVGQHVPLLAEALLSGASGQIRNAATMGGNLLQRTRCSYFRGEDWPCNKRVPGSGCAAQAGLHANHAVLGVSPECNAAHPSDLAVALLALDAEIRVTGRAGERSVPIESFFRLPGSTPHIETVLAAEELITRIDVPPKDPQTSARYLKLRSRASYEFATVSVAVSIQRDAASREPKEVSVALGGIGTVPWRNKQAERHLTGKPSVPSAVAAFCDEILSGAIATTQNEYKIDLVRGAIVRCLQMASAA